MMAPFPTPAHIAHTPRHKRPRHGASDAQCAISDLTRDADETTQAIVHHELEATGATATAAQPQSDDAPTSPAAEQLRDPRCPQHEQLFTAVCHYYTDKQHPRRPMPDAIQMARRMAREWSDCSHCFQLQDESLGYSEGWLLPPAARPTPPPPRAPPTALQRTMQLGWMKQARRQTRTRTTGPSKSSNAEGPVTPSATWR